MSSKNKIKILLVASTFPASKSDKVPAFVKDQIIAISKEYPNIKFDVLAPHSHKSKTKNFNKTKNYNEYRFHYFWPFTKCENLTSQGIMPALKSNKLYYLLIPFLFIAEFNKLLFLTIKNKPDVIYAHWFTPQGITSSLVSRLTKTPYILTTHASDVDVWKKIPILNKSIVKFHTKNASTITAVSRRSINKLKNFFNEEEWQTIESKTKIIPMGVKIDFDKNSNKTKNKKKNILFIGRLAEKKGVKYLLEAFSKLDNKKDYKLIIAGDGFLYDDLKNMAKRLKIDNYTDFVGYVSGDKKTELLESADIAILPSIITNDGDTEGLPVTFMESLAAGNLCITTNVSGADDIIKDGKDGFLIEQKNPEAILKTIKKIEKMSKNEINQIKNNAKKTSQRFDWKNIAKEHVDFFFSKLNLGK